MIVFVAVTVWSRFTRRRNIALVATMFV